MHRPAINEWISRRVLKLVSKFDWRAECYLTDIEKQSSWQCCFEKSQHANQQLPALQPRPVMQPLAQHMPAQQPQSCIADPNLPDLGQLAGGQLSMSPTQRTAISDFTHQHKTRVFQHYLHAPEHLHVLEDLLNCRCGYGLVTGG